MVEPESSHPVNRGPVVTVYLGNKLALALKLSACMPTSQSNSSSQDQCQCQRLCLGLRTRRETAEVRSNQTTDSDGEYTMIVVTSLNGSSRNSGNEQRQLHQQNPY